MNHKKLTQANDKVDNEGQRGDGPRADEDDEHLEDVWYRNRGKKENNISTLVIFFVIFAL